MPRWLKPIYRRCENDPAFARSKPLRLSGVLVDATEYPTDLTLRETDAFEYAQVAAVQAKLACVRRLRRVWRATWREAMDSLIFVTPLTLADHTGCLGDGRCYAPTAEAAWRYGWTGWGYRWNRGVVLTGVRTDEQERLSLFVQAVDQRQRLDLRLDEIGDGWARDEKGWLAFETGIHRDAEPAGLDPSRAAAMNMAAQIAWLSR